MNTHKDLIVWQKSMQLVKDLYQATKFFPKEEIYGITSQMRRAAVSIPSNIAEGYGKAYNKEIIHFLYISLGSASELETQLIICKDINYLSDEKFEGLNRLNNEIIRMLSSLINKRSILSC
ncbi:four helix bundle protein [uncultured Bacteroides sp.]|uniref:four helix bundle protein n=1 Tax=uncultured Bacteroides sp. TaxID=162156 RepID=UPI0025DCA223|nr:four helix bundle protein [uncultured Bacteroides sp.]